MNVLLRKAERLRAIKQLRKAAERAVWLEKAAAANHNEVEHLLGDAWRAFPECYRDSKTPTPKEILAICDRMEREEAKEESFKKMMKDLHP